MVEPAMDSRSPQPGTPEPFMQTGCSPNPLQLLLMYHYISQDPLQVRHHMTEFWPVDYGDRNDENDFQNLPPKNYPSGSFPTSQTETRAPGETFRCPLEDFRSICVRSQGPWVPAWKKLLPHPKHSHLPWCFIQAIHKRPLC